MSLAPGTMKEAVEAFLWGVISAFDVHDLTFLIINNISLVPLIEEQLQMMEHYKRMMMAFSITEADVQSYAEQNKDALSDTAQTHFNIVEGCRICRHDLFDVLMQHDKGWLKQQIIGVRDHLWGKKYQSQFVLK